MGNWRGSSAHLLGGKLSYSAHGKWVLGMDIWRTRATLGRDLRFVGASQIQIVVA